ncbi:MAG TPA: TrkH family potassium uptake protein [Spirochaetota bacterium]|nr:TrkH family potassium uptake protein [Spirochaetota bacterium]
MNPKTRESLLRSLDIIIALPVITGSALLLFAGHDPGRYASELADLDTVLTILLVVDLFLRIFLRGSLLRFFKHDWLALGASTSFCAIRFLMPGDTLRIALLEISPDSLAVLASLLRVAVLLIRGIPTLMSIRDVFSNMRTQPARAVISGFAAVILAGAVLLSLPQSHNPGQTPSFLDALFTSTSAVCVTGLAVVDTGTTYSVFGQFILLLLIQVGGLGIMTLAVFLALLVRNRVSAREQYTALSALDAGRSDNLRTLVRQILRFTLVIESIGAGLIFTWHQWFVPRPGVHDWLDNLWYAVFHSVSAFCNAGFSTNADSLIAWRGDPVINIVIMLLIILGGIGFVVIGETRVWLADRLFLKKKTWLSLHSRLALATTFFLILFGAVFFFFMEQGATLKESGTGESVLASLFQSVTTRTAGFNSLDFAAMTPATLFLCIALMFIGASPGSTGGGIKTTTFAVIWFAIGSIIRDRSVVVAGRRAIPREIVNKALAITGCFLALIFLSTLLILVIQPGIEFLKVLFEVVSASATVGLSTGITAGLEPLAKLVLIGTMFLGRIGPLTLIIAFGSRSPTDLRYPRERIMTG